MISSGLITYPVQGLPACSWMQSEKRFAETEKLENVAYGISDYQIIFIYSIFDYKGQRSCNKSEDASDHFIVYNLEQQISHYYHINHNIILFSSLTKKANVTHDAS